MYDRKGTVDSKTEHCAEADAGKTGKGLSQEQLAKRIGTQRSNICRIEKGTQNLSLDLMLKIAEALDKDVSVMLEERSSTMEKYIACAFMMKHC